MKDFEVLFENYDVQQQGSIKFGFVVLILNSVGIDYNEEKFKGRFGKEIAAETLVPKKQFLEIITKEYIENINKEKI